MGTARDTGFELRGPVTPVGQVVRDLWGYRELLITLARKDFFARYRRASFGVLWAVALPLIQAAILAVVFSRVVKVETDYFYPVFVLSGTVVWGYFSSTLTVASTAVVDGSAMTTKVYFPRAVLPLATVLANVTGMIVSVAIFVVLGLATGMPLGWRLLLVPVPVFVIVMLAAGLSLTLAALHVYFRDVRYVLQASLLAWFYVTPIFYPLDQAGRLAPVFAANPVTGAVELMRAVTIGADPGWGTSVAWLGGWLVVLSIGSLLLYRRYDRVLADLL